MTVFVLLVTLAVTPTAGAQEEATLADLELQSLPLLQDGETTISLPGHLSIAPDETDPVALALAVSQATFATAPQVLIARDDVFADALASGVLQGAPAPLLLVPSAGPVPDEVMAHIAELGASRAAILGGEGAVAPAVATQLEQAGLTVSRIAGPDRTATAVAVAEAAATGATTAILARAFADPDGDPSAAWADSVAVGGWAAAQDYPILVTATDALSSAPRDHLVAGGYERVFIAGGTAAVAEAVVTELEGLGIEVVRLSGASRFETAVAIARQWDAETSAGAPPMLVPGTRAQDWAAGLPLASLVAARGLRTLMVPAEGDVPATVTDYAAESLAAAQATATRTGDGTRQALTPPGGITLGTVGIGPGGASGIAAVIMLGTILGPPLEATVTLDGDRVTPPLDGREVITVRIDPGEEEELVDLAVALTWTPDGGEAAACLSTPPATESVGGRVEAVLSLDALDCTLEGTGTLDLQVLATRTTGPLELTRTMAVDTDPLLGLVVVGPHADGAAPLAGMVVPGRPAFTLADDRAAAAVDMTPDGSVVVAIDDRDQAGASLTRMDVELTADGPTTTDEVLVSLDGAALRTVTSPAVSPDGQQVAFSISDLGGGGAEGVAVADTSGADQTPVMLTDDYGFLGDQAWSADGDALTWWYGDVTSGSPDDQVVTAPADGSGAPQVLADGGQRPAVAPDGRVVDVDRLDGHRLLLVDPDGTVSHTAGDQENTLSAPSWDPTGTSFAVLQHVAVDGIEEAVVELAIYAADGTPQEAAVLDAWEGVALPVPFPGPRWGPDGRIAVPAPGVVEVWSRTDTLTQAGETRLPFGGVPVDLAWRPLAR